MATAAISTATDRSSMAGEVIDCRRVAVGGEIGGSLILSTMGLMLPFVPTICRIDAAAVVGKATAVAIVADHPTTDVAKLDSVGFEE